MQVLVVSENAVERLRAVTALELHAEADVVEVGTADEARRLLLEEQLAVDVLVVDGDLRPRGGFAVLYDLRARAELAGEPPVPALVMAAREADRWLAGWAGANEVLLKPVDPFELARRVAALEGADPVSYGDRGSAEKQVAAATRSHLRSRRP